MALRLLGISVITALVFSGGDPVQAAEARLRAASFQTDDVVFAQPFYRWVAEVNRRCGGQIAISVLGPGQIRAERQWFELRAGRIDAYFGPSSYYRGELSEADVLHLAKTEPATWRQNGAWAILNKLHNERLNAWYLATLIAGVKFFIYTNKPIRNGRFDGIRLRAVPLYKIFVENLGAQTTYMPAAEVRAALKNGQIDGFGWPLWGLNHFGWDELVRYRYGPGFMDTAAPVLINLNKWQSLSSAQRGCLTEMAEWAERMGPEWRAAENKRQMQLIRNSGIEYVDLGSAFARGPEDIFWKMLETASPKFVKEIRPLIE